MFVSVKAHEENGRGGADTLEGEGINFWPVPALKCEQNRYAQRAGPIFSPLIKHQYPYTYFFTLNQINLV